MAKQSKNLQKVQDMVDGNFKNKIQVGYSKTDERHEVGDKWTDSDGNRWEQKSGYKMKLSNLPAKGLGDNCKSCEALIVKPWDKDCYKADGRCYHCQLNFEIDLKAKYIRWFAYRRLKDFLNMEAIEKDMAQWVEEVTKERQTKVFDKSVANAMANSNVEMTINKNKTITD